MITIPQHWYLSAPRSHTDIISSLIIYFTLHRNTDIINNKGKKSANSARVPKKLQKCISPLKLTLSCCNQNNYRVPIIAHITTAAQHSTLDTHTATAPGSRRRSSCRTSWRRSARRRGSTPRPSRRRSGRWPAASTPPARPSAAWPWWPE